MKYSLIPIASLVLAQAASAQSVYSTEQIITNLLRTGNGPLFLVRDFDCVVYDAVHHEFNVTMRLCFRG